MSHVECSHAGGRSQTGLVGPRRTMVQPKNMIGKRRRSGGPPDGKRLLCCCAPRWKWGFYVVFSKMILFQGFPKMAFFLAGFCGLKIFPALCTGHLEKFSTS